MGDFISDVDVLMQNSSPCRLMGWGRVIRVETHALRPDTLFALQQSVQKHSASLLAYGCGRSYGDVALNSEMVLITTQLNRLIAFNENTLELICESGVTLRDIQMTFLPRGYALQTSPGTAEVTVGGAIANDVHGKNHDAVGSFGNHVKWLELLLSSGDIIHCSASENAPIFFATIGGLGLTGVIMRVCLQLQKNPLAVRVHTEMFSSVPDLISRLYQIRNEAMYHVAWIDLLSSKKLGRSILSIAQPDGTPLSLSCKTAFSVPRCARFFLNKTSMCIYNELYYRQAAQHVEKNNVQALFDYLYPLDAIANWNALYGKKGFYQFQCVIPESVAQEGIQAIISLVANQSEKPYLTVLKTLGSAGCGLLSFPLRGLTLAMDFPNTVNTVPLFKKLSELTLRYQGKVYLAKDACLSAAHFSAMYPRWLEFRQLLSEIDAKKMWQSELAKRLQIHG